MAGIVAEPTRRVEHQSPHDLSVLGAQGTCGACLFFLGLEPCRSSPWVHKEHVAHVSSFSALSHVGARTSVGNEVAIHPIKEARIQLELRTQQHAMRKEKTAREEKA